MILICDLCGAIAPNALSMTVHMARAHGEEVLRWPDGTPALWTNDIEPEDFMEGTPDA